MDLTGVTGVDVDRTFSQDPAVTLESRASMPEPGSDSAPSATQAAGQRSRRQRLVIVLLLVFGIMSAVCLGGLGFAYLAYDRATQPDRSTPTLVVRQYVDTMFSSRDPGRAKLFACGQPHLDEVQQ